MKNFKQHLLFFFLCVCCTESRNIFNTTEKIFYNFDKEISLHAKVVGFDSIVTAPLSIFYIDSFLLFRHHTGDFFFSLYNLQTNKLVGRFLQRGRGPNEFISLSYWEEHILYNGERWLYMSDINLRSVIRFNLTNYLRSDDIDIVTLNQYNDLQMKTHVINDSTFLAYMFTQSNNGVRVFYRKYFSTSDQQEEINLTVKNVGDYDEFDKLGGVVRIREDKKKMVMAAIFMNRVHIFDLEEEKNNITLTPNDHRDISLSELARQSPLQTTIYYADVRTTQDYIFALFHNQLLGEWQRKPKNMEIHVFDWNGLPLYRLQIDEYLASFCVDPLEKIMYAFDYEENIYQYDLSKIL